MPIYYSSLQLFTNQASPRKGKDKRGGKKKRGIYKKDSKHCSFLSVSFAHLYIKKNWYVKDQRFFTSFNIAA